MLTLLRDVIVLLSGGLTWEPGVGREPSADLPLSPRLETTASAAVPPSVRIQGTADSPGTSLPGR